MLSASSPEISALLESSQMWRARELLGLQPAAEQGVPTGFAALDAALPSQGWPLGQVCELLCAQGGCSEWPLILPALLAKLRSSGAASASVFAPRKMLSQLVLINAPFEPYMPAWLAAGIEPSALIKIDTSAHAQSQSRASWATEQALHCTDVCAVVAWLPRVPADALRRLQWAAAQAQALLFVVRPVAAREQSSPAALRLVLQRHDALHGNVHVFKCRGSAAPSSIQIELLSPQWRALLQARKQRLQSAPFIKTISQHNPVFRMTPRSQGIGLLPDHLLFGNERAAEGPAISARAHHGLDRTLTHDNPPSISISTNANTATNVTTNANTANTLPDRAIKRAARHERSR